ncbi:DUF3841 domain-containing protein [Nocardioidaceae bacterium]|nr:DUF3841 domain-containing protein [Nocardioidaceae bacterium]
MTTPVEAPLVVGPAQLAAPSKLPPLAPAEVEDFWRAGDSPTGMIRLLTVQAADAARALAAGERLTGSARHVTDRDVAAYAWMSVQLERLGWEVVDAPIWAWARVRFEELVAHWPSGTLDDVVVMVLDVPLGRTLLSAFDPWQELLDEGAEGTPNRRWARCLDIDAFPRSALQATLPFVDPDDVVRACRLRTH